MFGLKKSPIRVGKHNSADLGYQASSCSKPYDSDNEFDNKQTLKPSKRTSSEPNLTTPNMSTNPFDDDEIRKTSPRFSYSHNAAARNRYKNDFHDSGEIENQSVQELEDYAVYKAEETTKSVNSSLKIAEEIREDATKTLITLHHQGEQITRTHHNAADIDHDLSRGEKLLRSLGGMFSRTWKPKKTCPIMGPVITRDDPVQRKGNHMVQREKLGLSHASRGPANTQAPLHEPADAYQKVEVEKAKQDDALSELSNILGDLKDMAIDMGSEIDSQNKKLDNMQDDVDVINFRMREVNACGRRLLGK
ncbi:SNAP25 homologous protein SNAP33-like [Mangifera indica]|uniref:SNAP25 homologous protein SNAP33-like n=1 Tax=Mangifera indica TaxID=29780 RepID=UPI001CFAF6A7|nr:SNAP25 homologous protein SNAP33-like [Mangifera indica]XP_044486069.1 SNAP25 homologous protein SNAP33-like [Mangifera indica]